MNYKEAINSQYGQPNLSKKILKILERKVLNFSRFSQEILAPIEDLHLRGKEATIELAKEVDLNENMRILDVGCGIGGPARTLASRFGCHVTGLDLSKEYCTAAEIINKKLELNKKIKIQHGNALHMPFDNDEFDVVFMQHVLMNIENKQHLLSQIHRVLCPEGQLALFTICAGPITPIYFPVIWANDPNLNFLLTAWELRQLIGKNGFGELTWKDETKRILDGIQHARTKPRSKNPIRFELISSIVGDVSTKWKNIIRNLKEERICVIQGIFESIL